MELDRSARKMGQTAAAVSDAARSSKRAVAELSRVIRQDYKWSVVNVAWWVMMAALIVGVTLGLWASVIVTSRGCGSAVRFAPCRTGRDTRPAISNTATTMQKASA